MAFWPAFERATELPRQDGLVHFDELEGWAIGLEPNSLLGIALARRPLRGRSVAFFQGINSSQLILAEDGAIIRAFNPTAWPDEVRTPEEEDLPFEDVEEDPTALSLLVIERWTGLVVTPNWLLEHRALQTQPAGPLVR